MLKIIINQYKSQPLMEEEQVGNQKTRDFICACGKNYLSYAALFTHIKQKHDGKAPGPIVRPRSQRKRGRPRKNPLNDQEGQNSDSDVVKNGISFTNEINNNINLFQKKAKKAAQLLGCGQFQAFQAYRPDMGSGGKPKTQKQDLKNLNLKRCVSNNEKSQRNISKDDSISSNEVPDNLKHCKSAPSVKKESKNDHSSYHYNFVIQHMLDLFQDYQPSQDEYTYKQIIEIFDWIGQQMNSHSKNQGQMTSRKISLQNGFEMFLEQIQDYLEQFQYKQVSFLLSLFYQYICHQLGQPSNTMLLGVQISQFPKYVPQFLNTYLPKKVNQLSVECLYIFKEMNPRTVMMALCNWVSLYQLPQNSYEANTSQMINQKIKKSQKMTKKISVSESKQTYKQTSRKSQKINKIQSQQDDIKFQQFNQIFEKTQRNSKQKEQQKQKTEEDRQQDPSLIKQEQEKLNKGQQCELQSEIDYDSDSNSQQQENSSHCVDKNEEKQGKIVVKQQ